MKDKVSILMPCYNAEAYISEAISSLLEQSYSNFNLIIVDDGSTDSSAQICIDFSSKDHRIQFIPSDENKGIIFRRNQLLSLCDTEWACWADADDWYFPERIEEQLKFLLQNPNIDACSCNYIKFNQELEQLVTVRSERVSKEFMLFNNAILNPGSMFNFQVIRKHKINFDDTISGASDYKFWCEYLQHATFAQLAKPLVKYRIHDGQESSAQRTRQLRGHCETVVFNLKKYGLEVSTEDVARLLIFPCVPLGIPLTRDDHLSAIYLISDIRDSVTGFNEELLDRSLLQYARAHCLRLGLGSLTYLFKQFGMKWMANSNRYGLELIYKMCKYPR